MDFGALPPEINSTRMYSGAGPGPMLAAAASWDAMAAELHSAAAGYRTVISDLAGDWHGPSGMSMAAAATPYAEWMSATAEQAEQAALQAKAAATAYEAAFAATVPPPVVTANRSLLATLVATNILGQNSLAIAATEAHYATMWAQDAAAMYGYAGSSATATTLTPFTEPPQTTRADASAAQSTAVAQATGNSTGGQVSQLISSLPATLQHLSSAVSSNPVVSGINSIFSGGSDALGQLTGPYSPIGLASSPGIWFLTAMQTLGLAQNGPGVAALLNGPAPITGVLGPLSGGYMSLQTPVGVPAVGSGAVTVSMGHSASLGSLSVPSSWTSTAPAVRTAAMSMPASAMEVVPVVAADGQAGLLGEMALSSLAGRAFGGPVAHSVAGATVRVIDKAADTEELTTATILVIPASED